MKKNIKITTFLLISLILISCITACAEKTTADELWSDATYTSDTVIGEGKTSVTVYITAGKKSVKLTIKTDKDTLGDALFEHGIVNDPIFFDTCNGMKADFEKDKAYWNFKVNGKTANYGIGSANIVGGESFEIEYTK